MSVAALPIPDDVLIVAELYGWRGRDSGGNDNLVKALVKASEDLPTRRLPDGFPEAPTEPGIPNYRELAAILFFIENRVQVEQLIEQLRDVGARLLADRAADNGVSAFSANAASKAIIDDVVNSLLHLRDDILGKVHESERGALTVTSADIDGIFESLEGVHARS